MTQNLIKARICAALGLTGIIIIGKIISLWMTR